ncbi:DUF2280 domain-containing protein [Burkholderia multivorans]|uniref:DUF2280 domain-containing protein n=1 Tax=Burkholderia multivorans TaxID=87883 RepID=UPI0021BE49A2|nr:DUF2280 domain-containing protein [Burkholderia multivorans]
MTKLNDEAKSLIVRRLACYDTPKQAADAVKEEFGLDVSRQQCAAYDPTKAAGKSLSPKWREAFDATRRQFLGQLGDIPVANRAVRLKVLDRIYQRAENQGNLVLAMNALEQAAKEVGGALTNQQKVEHTGADGGPIKTTAAFAHVSATPEEYAAAVRKVLDEY